MSQSIEDEEKPEVTDVTVSFSGTGNIDNTTTIENIYNVDMLSSEVVGLVGVPVEIKTTSQFDEAVITFKYDDTQLGDTPEENLSVMWYDEENNWFQILDRESVVDTENNTVSVTTTHFSKYMLVDKEKWFNKWETELSYTRDNNQSYHFSFVVDVSGSMQGSSLASAKEALNQFADSFTEQDTKSLVAFNHTAVEVSHIWDTVEQFKTAVSNLRAGGGTSVRAGLSKGIEIVDAMDSSMPKVIILLCDGDVDYCNDLVEYCVTSKIKIFAVNVVTADSAALQDMAERTGGAYYIASTDSELTSVMNRINNEIDPTDTDSDGLPDVFEKQGMLTINGQTYKTNPSKSDSDDDGLSDGVEMGIPEGEDYKDYILAKFVYIGRGISCYRVYFNPASNPQNVDSDNDGIKDNEDTALLTKGLEGGIVGALKICSYNENGGPNSFGTTGGHAFLAYTSFINDYTILYGVKVNSIAEAAENVINKIDNGEDYGNIQPSYHIITFTPNTITTIGSWAEKLPDELKGTWIDSEYMTFKDGIPNYAYSLSSYITSSQLKK